MNTQVIPQTVPVITLTFSRQFNGISPLWLSGPLPFSSAENRHVRVNFVNILAAIGFPASYYEKGQLLCHERPSPLQHAVTLLLTYPLATVSSGPVAPKPGEWTDVRGSTVYGQILIPLPAEAVAAIRSLPSSDCALELELQRVELLEYERGQLGTV